eukprot:gene1118-10632_t
MSQLRQQLKHLKEQFPTSEKEFTSKEKDSFLFDEKESAKIRTEDIFLLALDGLSELIQIDNRFRKFKDELFDQKSIVYKRELQTSEVNQKLNEKLKNLLRLLSSYFLLTPAHKVIEYLIRKFKVQIYNVDDVMECILPYHESLLFSRFIHILNINNTRWEFLTPIKTSGAPLLREILIQRCHTDFTVLEFISNMTINMISSGYGYKTLVSFTSCVVIEYVEFKKIKQINLRKLFPLIFEGIKSEDVDFKNGSLMMLTQISSQVELFSNILNLIIELLIKNLNEFNLKNSLLSLIYLFQNQKVEFNDEDLFKKLIQFNHFFEELVQASIKYEISNFLRFLLLRLLACKKDESNLFSKFFNAFDIKTNLIQEILIQLYFNFKKNKDEKKKIQKLIFIIGTKNSESIDKGITFLLKNYPQEKEEISNFFNLFFKGTKHQFVEESNTTLYLTLEHPEASIRKLAIDKLIESSKTINDNDEILISLLRRLLDDDTEVVKAALAYPNLMKIKQKQKLFSTLRNLYMKKDKKINQLISEKLNSFILENPQHLNDTIPFIFDLIQNNDSKIIKLSSNLKHPLFFNFPKENGKIIECFKNNLMNDFNSNFESLSNAYENNFANTLIREVFILVLSTKVSFEIVNSIFNLIKRTTKHDKMDSEIFQLILSKISGAKFSNHSFEKSIKENSPEKLLIESFLMFQSNFEIYSNHIEYLFLTVLNQQQFKFLNHFWTSNLYSKSIEESCLNYSYFILKELKNINGKYLIPDYLISLNSEVKYIRELSIKCLKVIYSHFEVKKCSNIVENKKFTNDLNDKEVKQLLHNLLDKESNLIIDSKYFPSMLKSNSYSKVILFLAEFNAKIVHSNSKKLKLLNLIGQVHSHQKMMILKPEFDLLLSKLKTNNLKTEEEREILYLHLNDYKIDNLIEMKNVDMNAIFFDICRNCNPIIIDGVKFESPALYLLSQFQSKHFAKLSPEDQKLFFNLTLFCLSNENEVEENLSIKLHELLKVCPFQSSIIVDAMTKFESELEKIENFIHLIDLVRFMEKLKEKKKLIKPFFNILNVLKNQESNSNIDYLMNSIVTTLYFVTSYLEPKVIEKISHSYNVDLLIECLSFDNLNEKTKNEVIILIGILSQKFPENITKHLMSIFSIIESSLKNETSFEIIQKALIQIIPLVKDDSNHIKKIISIFIGSFNKIPNTERLNLFVTIVNSISRKKIHIVIFSFLNSISKTEDSNLLNFSYELVNYYSITRQLNCYLELIKITKYLFEIEESNDIVNYFEDEQDEFKLSHLIFNFITFQIENIKFMKRLTIEREKDEDLIQKQFHSIIENLIFLINYSTQTKDDALEKRVYRLLTKCQQLISIETFIDVTKSLLKDKNVQIRLKSVELFNLKLYDQTKENSQLLVENRDTLLKVVPLFIKQFKKETTNPILQQNLIIGIEFMSRLFGKDTDLFNEIIPNFIDQLSNENISLAVSVSMVLSTISTQIGNKSIQYVPKIANSFIRLMKLTFEEIEESKKKIEMIQLSILSSMEIFFKTQVKFINPYLADTFLILFHKDLVESENKKILKKLNKIIEFLIVNIEVRLLMTPLFSTFSSCLLFGDDSLMNFFASIKLLISNMKNKEIETNSNQILKFFLNTLEIRKLNSETIEDINEVEDDAIETFKTFIVKLNEKTFKPVFMKLLEWSREEVDRSLNFDKLITFYKIIYKISDVLKSIFLPFWDYLLEHSLNDLNSTLIEVNDKKKRKRNEIENSNKFHSLIMIICDSLKKYFFYDEEGLLNSQSKFELIQDSIMKQFENSELTSSKLFMERFKYSIIPCLSELSSKIPQSFYKPLQKRVLEQMQNENSMIKLVSISTIEAFYDKLGTSFIVMLPELVPYLAELLEDDNNSVIVQTKSLIEKIELISGQDLGEYFKK